MSLMQIVPSHIFLGCASVNMYRIIKLWGVILRLFYILVLLHLSSATNTTNINSTVALKPIVTFVSTKELGLGMYISVYSDKKNLIQKRHTFVIMCFSSRNKYPFATTNN